ncbi:MAG: F390 synthetase-related protein [Chitinophagales bacterium]
MFYFNILRHYLQLRLRKTFSNRQYLEAWQEQQIQILLKKIRTKSTFYKQQIQKHTAWQQFPAIQKKQWMQEFDYINTLGIKKKEALSVASKAETSRDFSPTIGNITIGLSSGTSGNRGLFLVTPKERAAWVAYVLYKILSPLQFRKRRIAFFLRANSNLYNSMQSLLFRFEFFDLKESSEHNLQKLNNYQPHILVAPASVLRNIAQTQRSKMINIQPEKILSVAEVLEQKDADFIQSVFEQTIHQAYQCTEGFLAVSCKYGTLHFNEDVVKIEKQYVDAEKRRYHPIITDFNRTGQPIIRYLLNDIVIDKKEPCPCGSIFQAIDHIEGRADDVFYFKNRQGKTIHIYPDFIRRAVILPDTAIEEYVVEQISLQQIHIFIHTPHFRADQKKLQISFEQLFEEYGIEGVELKFFDALPVLKESKLRRVKRSF